MGRMEHVKSCLRSFYAIEYEDHLGLLQTS